MNNQRHTTTAFFALTAVLLLSRLAASAAEDQAAAKPAPAIELGAPFGDNAILQRDMEVPVWGWSQPGTAVTVEFAGQRETAKAGADGKWMLKLKPLKTSAEPAQMLISDSTGKKVTLENLLVGEVWMASGQSNMQWLAGKSDVARIVAELMAKGEHPPIREFGITNVYSALHPIEHASGEWQTEDYNNYSAIAFAFAHKVYQEIKVPIGILNCSFSQTSIESWTPREGFAEGPDEYTKSVYQKIRETDPATPEHKAAWSKFYQDLEDAIKANAELVERPGGPACQCAGAGQYGQQPRPVVDVQRPSQPGDSLRHPWLHLEPGLRQHRRRHHLLRQPAQPDPRLAKCWNRPELPVYFNQFYCPNGVTDQLSLDSMSQMRLGTWLARDIPHTGMASQIDVTGAIHYANKAVSGQRLALHALKNQYGKDLVTDGPMFKSYKVTGDKVSVEFDFAKGGLVVG